MMHTRAAADPSAPARAFWGLAAIPLLVAAGYLGVADARVSAALAGLVVVAGWAALAWHHPRLVMSASFPLVLLAGTKFRMRDAEATLAGAADAQILMELGLFAVIGAGVLAAWVALSDRRRFTRTEAILMAYTAIAVTSTLWSVAPALSLVRGAQLAVLAGLAIVSVRALPPGGALWTACRAVAVYALACAAIALIVPAAAAPSMFAETRRFAWFAMHPIDAGSLAAIGLLGMAAAVMFRGWHGPTRVLGLPPMCYALALMVVLVMTNSRGPLLACAAGAGMLLLARVTAPVRISLVLTGVSCVLLYMVFGADVRAALEAASRDNSALTQLLFRGQDADTVLELNGRMELWQDLAPAISAHALTGYGYQASRAVILDAAAWAAYAHNALLQALLDLGLVGTLALLALIAIGLSGAAKATLAPRTRATLAALVVFLAVNSIATESFAGAPGIETLVLFVCALSAAPRVRDVSVEEIP
jgi:O-antigen ligase